MKKILISLFFCVQINLVFAQWINLNSGTDKLLLNLFVFNEDTLIAVGDSGIVLKTTNGALIGINIRPIQMSGLFLLIF